MEANLETEDISEFSDDKSEGLISCKYIQLIKKEDQYKN